MEVHLFLHCNGEALSQVSYSNACVVGCQHGISFLLSPLARLLQLRLDYRPAGAADETICFRKTTTSGLSSYAPHLDPSLHWPSREPALYPPLANGALAARRDRWADSNRSTDQIL